MIWYKLKSNLKAPICFLVVIVNIWKTALYLHVCYFKFEVICFQYLGLLIHQCLERQQQDNFHAAIQNNLIMFLTHLKSPGFWYLCIDICAWMSNVPVEIWNGTGNGTELSLDLALIFGQINLFRLHRLLTQPPNTEMGTSTARSHSTTLEMLKIKQDEFHFQHPK